MGSVFSCLYLIFLFYWVKLQSRHYTPHIGQKHHTF